MLESVYLEITSACNLACPFCSPHTRKNEYMERERFVHVLASLAGKARVLYFHLKGEPLLHPDFGEYLYLAGKAGFKVRITTNGTLLAEHAGELSHSSALERLNISLQSLSPFSEDEFNKTVHVVLDAVSAITTERTAGGGPFLASLRLWTRDNSAHTARALAAIEAKFGLGAGSLARTLASKNGATIAPKIALHTAETFTWPTLDGTDFGPSGFCRALRDHAGILVDGTVVPCCLDGEGILALGNIFESDWERILGSARSQAIYRSFTERKITEPLCRRCGYRTRFGL
jgi:MoaA/NifB/PqqE/SkfB family radical SAM enzyme